MNQFEVIVYVLKCTFHGYFGEISLRKKKEVES